MDFAAIIQALAPVLPARIVSDIILFMIAVTAICAFIAENWTRPAANSKWLPVYNVINYLARNRKAAENADDFLSKK